jgi:hypothetical protein
VPPPLLDLNLAPTMTGDKDGMNDAPDNDIHGYNFWLDKLNQFNGHFVAAEMVKAFINSKEYKQRFGLGS